MSLVHDQSILVSAGTMQNKLSLDDISKISTLLLNSCGNGPVLHIGSADINLIQHFLGLGVQVFNLDPLNADISLSKKAMEDRFIEWNGPNLPFEDDHFNTVLVTATPGNQVISTSFAEQVIRVSSANIFLYLTPHEPSEAPTYRKHCEMTFFQAGARKHPAYYRVNDYQSLQYEQGTVVIPLEKLPQKAALEYPLSALAEERDLHTDMTREPGSRSDAHIIRYLLAARYIRPGDRVLDAACGLGYGSQILLKCSDARSVKGIDGSAYAIKYADINFGENNPDLSFKEGWLPEAIFDIPDNSIDLITSFETLEHVQDPKALLAEFHRVLTPTGRIVLSVPNDWSDETGEDPNPFHFHVYTWAKILAETEKHFQVEAAFAQTADQYKKNKQWMVGTRQLLETSVDNLATNDPECEWCLLVGMKNPLDGANVPYEETTYDQYPENQTWQVTKLDDYTNPWLIKGMVTIGHRTNNREMLNNLSTQVVANSSSHSPDRGAGLCVLGYQLYENGSSREAIEAFDTQCQDYINAKYDIPQQLRWQVSLSYLLARAWQKWGETDKAVDYFRLCTSFNCAEFSTTLVTKQINAYRNLGLIESGRQNFSAAKRYWQDAVISAERALNIDWKNAYGSLENPTEFGLHELGAIIECASSCAYALKHIDNAKNRTPQWWHQLSRDRDSQLFGMNAGLKEVGRLNIAIALKDERLNNIGHALTEESTRLNAAMALKQEAEESNVRLNEAIISKDAQIVGLSSDLEMLTHEVSTLKSTLTQLLAMDPKNLRKIRIQRWKNSISARPLSMKGVAKAGAHTVNLVTPDILRQPVRRIIGPIVQRLRSAPAVTAQASPAPSTYIVKQPAAIRGQRPVVIHVIANFMTGGSSRLIVDIYEHLGDRYDQRIVTSYAPQPPCYTGIPISEIKSSEGEAPFIDAFKEAKPDFIHMHYWGDCDEVWYAKSMRAAAALGIPVVQNINTPVTPFSSEAIKLNVYVSNYVRDVFGEKNENQVTVYPGSDFSMFETDKAPEDKQDCIGMVYRLENDKLNSESIMPFIRAVQKKPSIKVLIVGGGSLMEVFQAATMKEGVEANFEFTGYVPYEALPALYERMKLFVAPVWKESFGQVSPFAMNMRVPVVGFDIGAIGEIVEDPALLAPAGNADALADIIVSLLEDTPRRLAIAERHRQRAQDHFSVQAMINGYQEIYSDLMAEKNK